MFNTFFFILLAAIFTSTCSFVIQPEIEAIEANETSNLDVTYYYAVDATQVLTSDFCQCLGGRYYTVFVRGYTSDGEGTVDKNALTTLANCRGYPANEIYMLPNPRSSKTGGDQLTEMYQSLTSNGYIMRRVWVQVTMGGNWSINSTLNVDFLKSAFSRAKQYGLNIGIFTSSSDWAAITGSWTDHGASMLWYYNQFGDGFTGESTADFSDFQPFAGFDMPRVKQFARNERICGATVNRSVYQQYFNN